MSMVDSRSPDERVRRRRPAERGFSLVEILIAVAFVAIAIMALASTTLAGHHFAQSEEARGVALQTMRAFLERMRGDEDWSGLYARLWDRVDPALVPVGATWPLTDYYSDLEPPLELGEVRVRVEVPTSPYSLGGGGTVMTLREDVARPEFGLPYDLNGDGIIDGQPRADDYRALPVIVKLDWNSPGEIPQTMRTTVWLRGER